MFIVVVMFIVLVFPVISSAFSGRRARSGSAFPRLTGRLVGETACICRGNPRHAIRFTRFFSLYFFIGGLCRRLARLGGCALRHLTIVQEAHQIGNLGLQGFHLAA